MFAKRDVFALLLSCFAVYYSTLSEGVVSFHPAFVVARDGFPGETAWDRRDPGGGVFASGDVDDPTDSGNARARDDRPPPPRFFDLNGDGVREMLVATGGGASGDEPTLRMVEMEERREEVRSDATSAYGANRNRQKNKKTRGARFSRSTREILAAEPRRGSAAFFGSADAFQRARVLARVSLLPERPSKSNSNFESGPKSDARDEYDDDGDVSGSRTPVAVGVGRVLPARNASSLNERRPSVSSPPVVHKGVVVVVTEGWHVVCFDHNLRVMWERALGKDFPKHAKPREAAVLVTAAALFKGDRGTVIVGGRVDLGVIDEEADTRGAFDPLNAELEREEAVRTRAGGERTRRENDSFPTFARHFNYYAFETGTGELRWKHESDDFHRDVRGLADALTPQHDHKLDAAAREASEGRHFGEAACREFRESVAASAMPHRWTGREDTRLALARFEHHKRAAKRRSTSPERSVKAETPETTTRKTRKTPSRDVASGEDAESFFTDVKNSDHLRPNAIVAHQEEGIEVVHLFGGRTLCKMLLTPLDAHADVNGDGVLEHVSARGGGGARLTAAGESFLDEKGVHEKEKHGDRACWARVSAGTPPRGAVFEGSICRGSMGVTRHARRDGGAGGDRADANAGGFISGNTVDVASPVALRRSRRDVRVASRLESRLASRRDGEARPPPDGRERSVSRLDSRRVSASDAARGAVFDLVFLNSRGEMTSYTHEGTRRWQLRTDSGWARGRGETPGLFAFPLRSAARASETPRAAEEPFEMSRDGAETEVALAVGATRATFVTPSGYVLATLTLPARPIAPAVIEDVNGDGLNDVVLRTERGTFAWTQKSRVGAKPFAVLAGALCLLVGGVFVAQVAHAHATGTKRLVRSTEMRDGEGRKDR